MTADEYERRLRDAVTEEVGCLMVGCHDGSPWHERLGAVVKPLLAFVRLRTVAGEPCYQFEAFSQRDCRQMDTLRRHDGTVKLCGPCSAQREMDKLLVAEVPK